MKRIEYDINFLSEWHCGAGLSAGADTDALVVKDVNGLPYVPGKTLKGLFREAAECLAEVLYTEQAAAIKSSFGTSGDEDDSRKGTIFFGNAEFSPEEGRQIKERNLTNFLYGRVYSTKINDESGTAEDGSLRSMETVVPCTLHGYILLDDETLYPLLQDAAKWIKHIGVNRNRGLGRVTLNFKNEGGKS